MIIELDHICWEGCPTSDQLRDIANQRAIMHSKDASSTPFSEDYEYRGMLGEWAFHRRTGLAMDLAIKRRGDAGIDFRLGQTTVDVKAGQPHYTLLLEREDKPVAKWAHVFVYVNVDTDHPGHERIRGWCSAEHLKAQPTKRITDHPKAPLDHWLEATDLWPMHYLWAKFL